MAIARQVDVSRKRGQQEGSPLERRRFFVESGIYEPEVDELPAGQGLQRGLITALWLVLPFWFAVGCMLLWWVR